jgi:sugar phosphate isomerase/epimerase
MAVELGLDGVEIYDQFLGSFEPTCVERMASQVRDRGLEVSMLTGYGDLARPEGASSALAPGKRRSDAIGEVKRNVDAAVRLGTRIVRVVGGMWPEKPNRDSVLSDVAAGLRECVAYARPKGIWLAFEDHPQVGTRIEDFVEILRRAGTDDLKVNLDTSNPLVSGDDPVRLAELVKDRVVHVHVSDRRADLKHVVTGTGVVNFPAIFRILRRAGFDGWLSVEAGGGRGRKAIATGVEYVKRTWAEA